MSWLKTSQKNKPEKNRYDVYKIKDPKQYDAWVSQNPDRSHFFPDPFIDNIVKLHRPGYLIYGRDAVPEQEIEEWCSRAISYGIKHAFVLMPDNELDRYYGNPETNESGKDVLFRVYQKYGIQVHHFPIANFGTPHYEDMVYKCKELQIASQEAAKENGKVAVHCSAGVGRTGIFTSSYMVAADKVTLDEVEALKDKNLLTLNENQQKLWYENNDQLAFIVNFAKLKNNAAKKGKPMDDPTVIEKIKAYDIKVDEWKKQMEIERQKAEAARKKKEQAEFDKKKKHEQTFRKPDIGGIEDWWKKYVNKDKGVQEQSSDVPPEDYQMEWDRKIQIEKMKRRQKKRPYTGEN